jgi:hypothetical protein
MWWKEEWNGIANELQIDFKNVDSNGGNVAWRNSKSMHFFSLKIIKIEHANKVQSFFSEWNAFSARKTSLFISFTSQIGMEWTKASLVGMDLSNMVKFSFIF